MFIDESNLADMMVGFLKELTRRIEKDNDHFANSYGTNFENDVFRINRYCWCDEDECKFCGGNEPQFIYKPLNVAVSWYKYIPRNIDVEGTITHHEFAEMVVNVFESIK